MRILIFGDSTAQGYYDLEAGGWANLLFIDNMRRKARRTDNPVSVFNASISGDTTRRIIDRLKSEVLARKWEDQPVMLVFAVGVNDAMLDNGKPLSSPEQYRTELEELYNTAQPLANHIIFVGLEAVNETESNPWAFNGGTHTLRWTNDRIEQFDQTLEKFAEEKKVNFAPVYEAFRKAQAKGVMLHEDGLHPNAAGHRLIYGQVKSIIEKVSI